MLMFRLSMLILLPLIFASWAGSLTFRWFSLRHYAAITPRHYWLRWCHYAMPLHYRHFISTFIVFRHEDAFEITLITFISFRFHWLFHYMPLHAIFSHFRHFHISFAIFDSHW
jgi:hypothetical protein